MTSNVPNEGQWRWANGLSLLLATPLALVFLLHPAAIVDQQGNYSHGWLMLVMLGISAGFVHGVGFYPRARIWKLLFGPYLGWPAMALGYFFLISAQPS